MAVRLSATPFVRASVLVSSLGRDDVPIVLGGGMADSDSVGSSLDQADIEVLGRVQAGLDLAADVSRADLLLWCWGSSGAEVVAQAQPRSIASLFAKGQVGYCCGADAQPLVHRALREGRSGSRQHDLATGTPVVEEVFAVKNHAGRPIAALAIETNLIAQERHRRRHRSFRSAVRWMQGMLIRGELESAARLSAFGEWDGILFVDDQRRIAYLSGIANNLYRRLGYLVDLRGTLLADLQTGDDHLVRRAIESGECAEEDREEGLRIWNRKVVPLRPSSPSGSQMPRLPWRAPSSGVAGALIMVHDLTGERHREQELRLKAMMVQEVHHRVKNNLQSVASLLRLQARRMDDPAATEALQDAVQRILSVAVIHEFLSQAEDQLINVKDVIQRIIRQLQMVTVGPESDIEFSVRGPSIYLPSRQATACALVVNELLDNALEHGHRRRGAGSIVVTVHDGGDRVRISVTDDAGQLPPAFDLDSDSGLGLKIVRTLVEQELNGGFELLVDGESSAVIEFPK